LRRRRHRRQRLRRGQRFGAVRRLVGALAASGRRIVVSTSDRIVFAVGVVGGAVGDERRVGR
jgi:hypothetical protein